MALDSLSHEPLPDPPQPLGSLPPVSPPAARTGCGARLVGAALFLAVILISFFGQAWSWLAVALGAEANAAAATAIQAAATLVLLLPFAWRWPAARERAIYRTWLAAAFYPLLLAATRLLPPTEGQAVYLLQLGATALYLLGLNTLLRRGPQTASHGNPGLAAAAAGVFAAPWLLRGALGSPLDLLLALLLGLAFGTAFALLFQRLWLSSLAHDARGRGADIFTGGLVGGAALVVLGSGLSLNGLQLVLMAALPGLAWLAAALAYTSVSHLPPSPSAPAGASTPAFAWLPPALLIGIAAASMLALVDFAPLAIEIGDPALGWAWQAAAVSIVTGWLLGLAASLWRFSWGAPALPGWSWGAAAAIWAAATALFFLAGRPGFYGDRLFVILRDQADVSAAVQIADYDARRRSVYAALVDHAATTQADLRATLDRFGVRYTPYYLVNAVEVEGGLPLRLLLAMHGGVSRILPSPRLRPLPGPLPLELAGEASLPPDHAWNLRLLGAQRVWDEFGARGRGIVIGQSDSGVEAEHPELADAYRGRTAGSDYNWFDPWSQSPAPVDYGGHGTHTLGSVLGNTTGVAPDATWIGCANLQRNLGNPALYLDCLQFMLAPFAVGGDPFVDGDPLRSAHVLNNSWGCPAEHEGCDPASLQGAVDALRAAGIFVVASAGNDGPRCSTITDPIAIYDASFSVGAVDEQRNLAPFSSAGPVTVDGSRRMKPDIAAPGVDVWSAFPGQQYAMLSGTSMAGPHVAGVVALLWSADPTLIGDIEATEQLLRETAQPFSGSMPTLDQMLRGENASAGAPADVGDACIYSADAAQTPNNLVGYGIVDAYAAVQRALGATP